MTYALSLTHRRRAHVVETDSFKVRYWFNVQTCTRMQGCPPALLHHSTSYVMCLYVFSVVLPNTKYCGRVRSMIESPTTRTYHNVFAYQQIVLYPIQDCTKAVHNGRRGDTRILVCHNQHDAIICTHDVYTRDGPELLVKDRPNNNFPGHRIPLTVGVL